MKIQELLKNIVPDFSIPKIPLEIEGLSENSKTVKKNFLFFARAGAKNKGTNFIHEALNKGAVAICAEEKNLNLPVPIISVSSVMELEAPLANRFYGNPSRDLRVVGVTGTNGKTTFTYLLEAAAKEIGWKTGVIGTINYRLPKLNSDDIEILPAPNTTPNALELQSLLHALKQRNADLVVMEVSSHALSLNRTEGIEFDGAVFTNLTQDHLDHHENMENYFEAKLKLFKKLNPNKKNIKGAPDKFSVLNMDDPYSQRIELCSGAPVTGYGIKNKTNFFVEELELHPAGSNFVIETEGKKFPIHTPLLGQHNVYNILAAIAASFKLKIPISNAIKGMEKIKVIPGRLENISCGQNFNVVIDYAHTEDALKNVLLSLKQFAPKRILTLFGCGGDRDRSKRPLMGSVAAALSDWVILTSDNPRSEDPEKIILDIEVGIHRLNKNNYEIILNRETAIKKILKIAKKDDLVLIAGKGHETYQIFKDQTIHFDDREITRKYLCKA